MDSEENLGRTVIIGAGPAGLTAAYELMRRGEQATVLESTDAIGGISQTVERNGWRFDIGGHRFFSKLDEIRELWLEMLEPEEWLTRPRSSRIYYNGRFFDYPLKPLNALRQLGLLEAVRCITSFAACKIRPPRPQDNFEAWVAARFGWRLYRTFFKSYTEKVWGVPASSLSADWAAQRIKNLSLWSAITSALVPRRGKQQITSLIEQFQYPKLGPGMLWERVADRITSAGSVIHPGARVTRIVHAEGMARHIMVSTGEEFDVSHVLSSMPLGQLVACADPTPPPGVLQAAQALTHRDFLTVAHVVPSEIGFPDNWIYIHDPGVQVGRIQNFGEWSPYMVKPGFTCLGMEYFVHLGQDLGAQSDDALIDFSAAELIHLGLARRGDITESYVFRMPNAYPVYDQHYVRNVSIIRDWLDTNLMNVYPIGRNGMHRYNNQDHSMLAALRAIDKVFDGSEINLWTLSVDDEYLESESQGSGRQAPLTPLEHLDDNSQSGRRQD